MVSGSPGIASPSCCTTMGEAPDGVSLRFAAEDVASPSLVEAAVDDIHVWRMDAAPPACPRPPLVALAATPIPSARRRA